jgi:hypothetical protein
MVKKIAVRLGPTGIKETAKNRRNDILIGKYKIASIKTMFVNKKYKFDIKKACRYCNIL